MDSSACARMWTFQGPGPENFSFLILMFSWGGSRKPKEVSHWGIRKAASSRWIWGQSLEGGRLLSLNGRDVGAVLCWLTPRDTRRWPEGQFWAQLSWTPSVTQGYSDEYLEVSHVFLRRCLCGCPHFSYVTILVWNTQPLSSLVAQW